MFKVRWLLIASALIVLANAAPVGKDSEAEILNNEYTIDEKGNYKFSFKTSNGITREEKGTVYNEGQPNQYIDVIGLYTYFDTEGKEVTVEYRAGEDGYYILPPDSEGGISDISLNPNVVASLLGKYSSHRQVMGATSIDPIGARPWFVEILTKDIFPAVDVDRVTMTITLNIFRTSNAMTKEEIGSIVNEGEPDVYVSIIGRYTYFNSEGKEGKFGYTAGEDRYNNILPQVPQTFITAANPTKPPKLVASLLGK